MSKLIFTAFLVIVAIMAFNSFNFVYIFSLVPLLQMSACLVILIGTVIGHKMGLGFKYYLAFIVGVLLMVSCVYIVVEGAILIRNLLMLGGMALAFLGAVYLLSGSNEKNIDRR